VNRAGAKTYDFGGLGNADTLGQLDAGAFDLLGLSIRPAEGLRTESALVNLPSRAIAALIVFTRRAPAGGSCCARTRGTYQKMRPSR
jgi:hypothetical protein